MKNEIMKKLNFGVEIEFTGCTREKAATIIATYFGTMVEYEGGTYHTYAVKDGQGRTWKVMYDGSIYTERKRKTASGEIRRTPGSSAYSCELVTPILQYKDIEDLQEIVRLLRTKAYAVTNKSTGIHIHVGAESFEPQHLVNIANIFYQNEDMIYAAIECDGQHRNLHYCQKTDVSTLSRLNGANKNKSSLERAWYNNNDTYHPHYDESRYHGLNLHAYWTKNTVEFRCFNSELHAGKVKTYIQLCLAMAQQALTQQRTRAAKKQTVNPKYTFRCWLLRLGLIGDEFKTCRHHLLKHLEGNASWLNGKPNQSEEGAA
ncbi:MAG: amidoligase family protein [Selenomonadaceae bacterium]